MINGRRKGHAFERKIASQFRQEGIFPNCKRHLEYQVEDCDGIDLDYTGDWYMQLKRNKCYAPINKIKDIKLDDKRHCLITKADKEDAMAVINLKDFIYLLKCQKAAENIGGR